MAITPLYTKAELDTEIERFKAIERSITVNGSHETTIDGTTRKWTARNIPEITAQLNRLQNERVKVESGAGNGPQFLVGRPYRGKQSW
jgi:hypothetical protein